MIGLKTDLEKMSPQDLQRQKKVCKNDIIYTSKLSVNQTGHINLELKAECESSYTFPICEDQDNTHQDEVITNDET